MNAFLVLVAVACMAQALAFVAPKAGTWSSALNGGTRTMEEVGKSKKALFRDIRSKLDKAAETPGFFEIGEGPPEIELFCKSNGDGTQIGDCPYAQFIQLVLLKKGLRYTVRPTMATNKPDWLTSKHEGKMPALMHKDTTMTESLAIAEYIEKTFPQNSLTRMGAYSYQEVLEKTAGFFPALSALIKNTDDSKDASLLQAVEGQLDVMDEIIRSSPGRYICGIELTLADLYLVPQLFHAMVTMEHFKGVEFYHMEGEPTRPALENYVARMFDTEEFNNKKAYYNVDQVIAGWKAVRGDH